MGQDAKNHYPEDGSPGEAALAREQSYLLVASHSPHSMRDALRSVNGGKPVSDATASGETSEEDYDKMTASPVAVILRRKRAAAAQAGGDGTEKTQWKPSSEHSSYSDLPKLHTGASTPGYVLTADEKELVRQGVQRAGSGAARRGKFSDMVFTRKFSAFDRQNKDAANSPFHGFFTLFWMAMFLFMVKIGAENWKKHGNPLGTNEMMKTMFRRDVLVLLFADGIICGLTGVSWLLQKAMFAGYIDWDRSGWVIQNVWQTLFIGGVVGLTLIRDWEWPATVYFVMHGLVMVMKQHSYGFYNGYLSTVHKKRKTLLVKLKQLEKTTPLRSPSTTNPPASAISTSHLAHAPSAEQWNERRKSMPQADPDLDNIAAAIDSGDPLDEDQVRVFERMIKWEVDALTDELQGKATSPSKAYPNNLTMLNHYEWIVLPTLVYELEYPRSETINWYYAAEKLAACFGVIFVMIMVSQAFIYPVVMETVRMKEVGMPMDERFQAFPWLLLDLIFPFLMEYLMAWYLIWETILNFLAELTYFADRNFYAAWWNSVSWDMFARDWNRPVHNFLLRHVYHSSISAMKVNKHTATLITFFLSACVHELVMWCIFKKLRGYLLVLQMCQLPLVRLSRTKWLRNQPTIGNMVFWLGILMGPSSLCSLYLIL